MAKNLNNISMTRLVNIFKQKAKATGQNYDRSVNSAAAEELYAHKQRYDRNSAVSTLIWRNVESRGVQKRLEVDAASFQLDKSKKALKQYFFQKRNIQEKIMSDKKLPAKNANIANRLSQIMEQTPSAPEINKKIELDLPLPLMTKTISNIYTYDFMPQKSEHFRRFEFEVPQAIREDQNNNNDQAEAEESRKCPLLRRSLLRKIDRAQTPGIQQKIERMNLHTKKNEFKQLVKQKKKLKCM